MTAQKRNSIAIDIESLSSKSGLGLVGGGGGGMLSARSGYGVLEDDGRVSEDGLDPRDAEGAHDADAHNRRTVVPRLAEELETLEFPYQ